MLVYLAGVAAVVFLLVIYLYWVKPSKTHVLITGICDSGKTSLFTMLTHKKNAVTFTSLAPNVEDYQLKTRVCCVKFF